MWRNINNWLTYKKKQNHTTAVYGANLIRILRKSLQIGKYSWRDKKNDMIVGNNNNGIGTRINFS